MTTNKPTGKVFYHRLSDFHVSHDVEQDALVKDASGSPTYFIEIKKRKPSKFFSKHHNTETLTKFGNDRTQVSLLNEWLVFLDNIDLEDKKPGWNFTDFIECTYRQLKNNSYADFLTSVADATSKYLDERDNKKAPMASPSKDSFIFFLRYVPYFKNFQSTVYIESKSGQFGITIEHGNSLLDLQVKDNSDLIYSYVKPGLNGCFPSISGEAILDDSRDSHNVEKILRMIYD